MIDQDKWYLDVGGMVNKPQRLTLKDLQNESLFPRQSSVVTLQCSGTRRIEQINEYPGEGDELINAPVCGPNGKSILTADLCSSGPKVLSVQLATPVSV